LEKVNRVARIVRVDEITRRGEWREGEDAKSEKEKKIAFHVASYKLAV
jgi:hypothetical protein